VQWFEACVAAGKKRKTMIVALARKLLIALWRFVTLGEVPDVVILTDRKSANWQGFERSCPLDRNEPSITGGGGEPHRAMAQMSPSY
jgi:hypothetical protein